MKLWSQPMTNRKQKTEENRKQDKTNYHCLLGAAPSKNAIMETCLTRRNNKKCILDDDDVGVAYIRLQKKLQDVWLKGHDVCITCRLMLVVAVRQHTVTTVRYQRY